MYFEPVYKDLHSVGMAGRQRRGREVCGIVVYGQCLGIFSPGMGALLRVISRLSSPLSCHLSSVNSLRNT